MREIQTLVEIEPLTTVVNISMEVNPVNDNPFSYVALNGEIAGNGREAEVSSFTQSNNTTVYYKISFSAFLTSFPFYLLT